MEDGGWSSWSEDVGMSLVRKKACWERCHLFLLWFCAFCAALVGGTPCSKVAVKVTPPS